MTFEKLKFQIRGTPNGKSYSFSTNLITRKVCDVLVENIYVSLNKTTTPNSWDTQWKKLEFFIVFYNL